MFRLPDDPDLREKAIENMTEHAVVVRNRYLVWWRLVDLFMRGVRSFYLMDYDRGEVVAAWVDQDAADLKEGDIPFRFEEAVVRIHREVGRLMRINLEPRVSKRSKTLESMRGAAMTQVAVDHMEGVDSIEDRKQSFMSHLVQYGMCPVGYWREEVQNSWGHAKELIPVWECLASPAGTNIHEDERVIIRDRIVPFQYIERNKRFKLPKDESKLDFLDIAYGVDRAETKTQSTVTSTSQSIYRKEEATPLQALKKKKSEGLPGLERCVRLREVYTHGYNGAVGQVSVWVGRAEVDYQDLAEKDIPFPIGFPRYHDTGHFYGLDFSRRVLPMANKIERTLRAAVTNSIDLNRYGYVLVPTDWGLTKDEFKDTGGLNPRLAFYESANLIGGKIDDSIKVIQPIRTTDVLIRTSNLLSSELDRITGQGPWMSGQTSGREDSSLAIQSLAEGAATHLETTVDSIDKGMRQVFRGEAAHAHDIIKSGKATSELIDVVRADPSLAGVMITESGQVQVGTLKVPQWRQLKFSIASKDVIGNMREREEALLAVREGRMLPLRFIILNYKHGWGYQLGGEAIYEAYILSNLKMLRLFNDGETPAPSNQQGRSGILQVEVSWYDDTEVMALAFQDFTSPTTFSMSSKAVKDAFRNLKAAIENRSSNQIPDQAPAMTDVGMQEPVPMTG